MSETDLIESPDDVPIGDLMVVTEDGRPLRIIAARLRPFVSGFPRVEITVAEEGA
jgi:hypothetical protein